MTISTNRQWAVFLSLIAIAWIALIYVESSQPPPKILGEMPGLDKVAHFAVYSILGLMTLAILALLDTNKKIPVLPVAVLLVVIAGVLDEFHQAFVPERSVDGWDLLADFCGGLFAAFVTHRFMNKGSISRAST